MITQYPPCDHVADVVFSQLKNVSRFTVPLLIAITVINFVWERKMMKAKTTQYLYFLLFHLGYCSLIFIYTAYLLNSHCVLF
ncbi:hypothetical protein DQQ10_21820 [Pseudochryseolinea flava]|uniref:DUF5658 domain-containing protein n=1 Tax=Pseudochryseolinea flava TaxID=2059302 RepID=A0A364XY72_9BACT|nr:hypothetical protein DQQ10_21820 [Pseudochryseolinea flava]